ncbi:MAG: hypothetical protein AB1349_10535 [Elusimicrobiota bacterium]
MGALVAWMNGKLASRRLDGRMEWWNECMNGGPVLKKKMVTGFRPDIFQENEIRDSKCCCFGKLSASRKDKSEER